MEVFQLDTRERIFQALDKSGMEQKEFAIRLGITDKIISAWRTGRSRSYQKYISQIAEVLDTTVGELLGEPASWELIPEPGPYDIILKFNHPEAEVRKKAMQAAFWGGDKDLSQEDMDAMWGDVEKFAAFLAEQKKQEKKNG